MELLRSRNTPKGETMNSPIIHIKQNTPSHMKQWERLMGSMIHTVGTKESDKRKADLVSSTYFRALNKPYQEQQEFRAIARLLVSSRIEAMESQIKPYNELYYLTHS
jgi:hypothetical protein